MYLSVRSYLTAGVAALGAVAIATPPVQPAHAPADVASDRVAISLAVELAASIDPITPWVDTVTRTWDNLTGLVVLYLQQPFPLLTTIARNQLTYLEELPDIGLVASQVWGNVQTFFTAPYEPTPDNISDALITTVAGLPISQQTVYGLLQTILDGGGDLQSLAQIGATQVSSELQSLIEFTATPASGELIGLLGPVISPLVQLTQSFTAVGEYFQAGDVSAALNELINIPAATTNAALNGGTFLNLTAAVQAAGLTLPPEVKSIGFNMGGLLNVVPVAYQPPTVPTPDNQSFTGGLAFDALATEVESPLFAFQDPGWPVGAIASVIGLGQALGDAMLVTPPDEAQVDVAATAAVEGSFAVPVPTPADTAGLVAADMPEAVTDIADETPETGRAAVGSAKSSRDTGRLSPERATSRAQSHSRAARNAD